MTLWAIGDVQGCMSSLERLVDKIAFDPARDRVWLVGDLVNRGPRSLDVLRWAKGLGDAAVVVLGNHELHLLARAAGVAEPKRRDTIDDILHAPDRDALVDWLRARPLAHAEGEHLLVHAGLHPRWSVKKTRKLAGEIETALRGDGWRGWLAQIAGKGGPVGWDDELEGPARARAILSYLVRARCLDGQDVPDATFTDHPRRAPAGLRPWFEARDPAWRDAIVVFGHWAALGLSIGTRHRGLDSGCVWGKHLTALRLNDDFVVQVEASER